MCKHYHQCPCFRNLRSRSSSSTSSCPISILWAAVRSTILLNPRSRPFRCLTALDGLSQLSEVACCCEGRPGVTHPAAGATCVAAVPACIARNCAVAYRCTSPSGHVAIDPPSQLGTGRPTTPSKPSGPAAARTPQTGSTVVNRLIG